MIKLEIGFVIIFLLGFALAEFWLIAQLAESLRQLEIVQCVDQPAAWICRR